MTCWPHEALQELAYHQLKRVPRLAAAFLVGTGLVAGNAVRAQQASKAPTRHVELARVDVTRAERQTVAVEVRVSGSLSPVRRSVLTSKVTGTIEAMPVQVGDVVRSGDLLLRFESKALDSALAVRRAELDSLKAQLSLAEATLERATRLGERGVATEASRLESEAKVLDTRAQIRAKQAAIEDAERALRDAVVAAPFDGILAARPVAQGQTVPVNTELMTLVDLSQMEVDAGVPTSRIPVVKIGQPVELTVEGFSGRTFIARVARISPTAVAGSRAIRVFLTIANDEKLLRGGMFTTGTLRVDEQPDVIAMPSAAIRHDKGGTFVLKLEDGMLRRVPVKLGTNWTDRDLVEVSDVKEGETIVTAPLPSLTADTPATVEGP